MPIDLTAISTEDLQAELERRRLLDADWAAFQADPTLENWRALRPDVVEAADLDIQRIVDQAELFLEYLVSDEYEEPHDWADQVFRAAMMGLYGSGVWDWIDTRPAEPGPGP